MPNPPAAVLDSEPRRRPSPGSAWTGIGRALGRVLALALDVLVLLGISLVLWIVVTGGGTTHLFGIRVSARSVTTPLGIVLVVLGVRLWSSRAMPFLGIRRLAPDTVQAWCVRLCARVHARLSTLTPRQVLTVGIVVTLASLAIKVANAHHYFGFFSGDDVEVHQMTFARLFDWDWRAWELRSPFYPMVFIYPVQALLVALGNTDPAALIFAGRLVVIGFSLLNLVLVYLLGRQIFGARGPALVAMILLASSKLHTCFASTELPRTVASTFVLLAALLLLPRPRRLSLVAIAGLCLGVGASIRFSEAMFLLPAAIGLLAARRFGACVLLVLVVGATSAVILGVGDWLYWGDPFHSLSRVVQYTLVDKQSSRGFQPVYHYLTTVTDWADLCFAGFVLLGLRQRPWMLVAWAAIPFLCLSALPHKESRYLVPVLPFLVLVCALGVWTVLGQLRAHTGAPANVSKRAYLVVLALVGLVFFELGGARFRRSEDAVTLARFLARQPDVASAGIEQSWKTGDRLYLSRVPELIDLDPGQVSNRDFMAVTIRERRFQWLALRTEHVRPFGYEELLQQGGYREVAFAPDKPAMNYRLWRLAER